MYRKLGPVGNLYEWLWTLDQQMAAEVRARGCPCGGTLHSAHYPRKPRGGPGDLGPAYEQRLSFCCGAEGCRRRATPPSARFLGRRVFLGVVVVLATAVQAGLAPRHVRRLREAFDCDLNIDPRTLARWVEWWQERLPRSTFWQGAKAYLLPPVCPGSLPASLLERFELEPDPAAGMVALLRFLTPLSTGPLVTLDEGRLGSAEDAN
jgi:hypothetical protein